jgi:mannose/fructose/N-acetylgalactosamine-specific phosphotransferase system component IIC
VTGLLSALLYGVLSIDHFAVGPFLLSRPLVLGALLGALWGRPAEGLALGLLGESLWVVVPPAGPSQWDTGLAVALACVWAFSPVGAVPAQSPRGAYLAVAFLASVPFAVVARRVDVWLRRNTRVLADYARAGFNHGVSGPFWRGLVFSMVLWGFKSLVVFFVAETLGALLCGAVFPRLTGPLAEGLDQAWRLWPALGAATLWHLFFGRLGKNWKSWFPSRGPA